MTNEKFETESKALKDRFNLGLLSRIAASIRMVYPEFDQSGFVQIGRELRNLEMKSRVQLIRQQLKKFLPAHYPDAVRVLLESAKSGHLKDMDLWPYSDFVRAYGLEDIKVSLHALKDLTPIFTSEFAVRPFLLRYPTETLGFLEDCSKSTSVDVRRWASEGTRPRLPWGERLKDFILDPSLALPILENLKFDSELYVRKSVSNHLNDIAKDHPDWVLTLLRRWKKAAGSDHHKEIDWIVQRSLRTLIKAGHPEALKLMGVSSQAQVTLSNLKINQKEFKIGQKLEFSFKLKSRSDLDEKIVVDYIIHFVKANQATSPKVFKLASRVLPANEEIQIFKTHYLKKVTTRVHYSGVHYLEVQVNGQVLGRLKWKLNAS